VLRAPSRRCSSRGRAARAKSAASVGELATVIDCASWASLSMLMDVFRAPRCWLAVAPLAVLLPLGTVFTCTSTSAVYVLWATAR